MSFLDIFSSHSSNSNQNTSTDSHATTTTTTNIDQSQVQTNSQEISINHTNSDNSSWSQVTDASVKAMDSFNKNFNIQTAMTLGGMGSGSDSTGGFGSGLDLNSFFSDAQVPFKAGADRAVGSFFSSSSTMKTWLILGAVGLGVWWFFFRKK